MPVDVLIAVGSNIEPEVNIPKALHLLNKRCPIDAVSTFYRTIPVARDGQPEFLNGACRCTVSMTPRDLKYDVLREIEAELGRVRGCDTHAARTIDLDIGLMGDLVVEEDGLSIPDPDIESRAFLAIPFAEIAPDTIIPTSGKTLSDLASSFDDDGLQTETDISELLRLRYQK